jgi:hypothetical protein
METIEVFNVKNYSDFYKPFNTKTKPTFTVAEEGSSLVLKYYFLALGGEDLECLQINIPNLKRIGVAPRVCFKFVFTDESEDSKVIDETIKAFKAVYPKQGYCKLINSESYDSEIW